jgi:hypothetical protein
VERFDGFVTAATAIDNTDEHIIIMRGFELN